MFSGFRSRWTSGGDWLCMCCSTSQTLLVHSITWGIVNGSLVAANHLKRKGGALINLGSIASDESGTWSW